MSVDQMTLYLCLCQQFFPATCSRLFQKSLVPTDRIYITSSIYFVVFYFVITGWILSISFSLLRSVQNLKNLDESTNWLQSLMMWP